MFTHMKVSALKDPNSFLNCNRNRRIKELAAFLPQYPDNFTNIQIATLLKRHEQLSFLCPGSEFKVSQIIFALTLCEFIFREY